MDLSLYILVLRGWKSVFGVLAPFEVHFNFYLVILFIDHLLDSTDQLWRRKYDSFITTLPILWLLSTIIYY